MHLSEQDCTSAASPDSNARNSAILRRTASR
ncbi:hypothetical protein AQB9606_03220 [Aquabacterium sp. CECT 9606]|nr:hypothetical protein AQB9606_03220 [Aquabacterium sp. CECT 9606]